MCNKLPWRWLRSNGFSLIVFFHSLMHSLTNSSSFLSSFPPCSRIIQKPYYFHFHSVIVRCVCRHWSLRDKAFATHDCHTQLAHLSPSPYLCLSPPSPPRSQQWSTTPVAKAGHRLACFTTESSSSNRANNGLASSNRLNTLPGIFRSRRASRDPPPCSGTSRIDGQTNGNRDAINTIPLSSSNTTYSNNMRMHCPSFGDSDVSVGQRMTR